MLRGRSMTDRANWFAGNLGLLSPRGRAPQRLPGSLIDYDGTAGYLVENPINRYLINSTTEGLVLGDDGSLTITIQHEQPKEAAEKANWLPAPAGPFYLVMRIYWPEQAALSGVWTPPPVQKV